MNRGKYRAIFIMALLSLYVSNLSALTTLDECEKLNTYFGDKVPAIESKISHYKKKLKSNANDKNIHFALGILYSALANQNEGNFDISNTAREHLETFLNNGNASYHLANGYYAMAWALMARDHKSVVKKIGYTQKAIKLFDQTVNDSKGKKDYWYIRFLRGNTYINLPEDIFHKFEVAKEDFKYVEIYTYSENPGKDLFALPGYMITVFYNRGEIEKSNGNIDKAIEYWKKSVKLYGHLQSDAIAATKAQKRLDVFSD